MLRKLRILDEEDKATFFGVLGFAPSLEVQAVLGPAVSVAVTQYQGTAKVNAGDVSSNAIDDREFRGDIYEQYLEAYKFILSKIPTHSRIGPNGLREERPVIPNDAIREALANAIAHRDYSVQSTKVQIDIFADRIEFINPGMSLVPIHELERAPSQARNPVLMEYLRDMDVTENRARGIYLMITYAQQAGLLRPEFTHRSNCFVATLYLTGVWDDDDRAWLRRLEGYGLTEAEMNILVKARHSPTGVSNAVFREVNHMNSTGDDVRAARALSKLVSQGLLEPKGQGRSRHYILGKHAK